MVEDSERLWSQLKITNMENMGYNLPKPVRGEVQEKGSRSLIGKVLSIKAVNIEALIGTMKAIWKPSKGLQGVVIGEKHVQIGYLGRSPKMIQESP
ncbi:hypothetical protein ACH5RR_026808 [Cinchona calisaya]|uniref:DUF4283 domain-containing protein n=1 Tax=Cinchona calisaya TaxID=153742 RepID=A0ABD2Z5I4_9GENT